MRRFDLTPPTLRHNSVVVLVHDPHGALGALGAAVVGARVVAGAFGAPLGVDKRRHSIGALEQ